MERLQSHRDFVRVLKRRAKVSEKDIVVHFLVCDDASCDTQQVRQRRRLGLAVAKNVGNAVTRNTIKRRFRVLARRYEDRLPARCDVVMRAKPGIERTQFTELDRQVAQLFDAIGHKARHMRESHGRGALKDSGQQHVATSIGSDLFRADRMAVGACSGTGDTGRGAGTPGVTADHDSMPVDPNALDCIEPNSLSVPPVVRDGPDAVFAEAKRGD